MAINLRKYFSLFGRTHHFITRVLETNIPLGYGQNLVYRDGLHTIKNIETEEREKNPRKGGFYELLDNNIVKGYLSTKDKSSFHIINENKKIVKVISLSYYHALLDDLAEIIYALTFYPKAEVILEISNVSSALNLPHMNFFGYFLDRLAEEKIKYQLVDASKYDLLYINNFAVAQFPFHSGGRLDLLNTFMTRKTDKYEKPFRKIFISRKLQGIKPDTKDAENFSYPNDNRIDDHKCLEQIFIDLGFEILDAELIPDFKEQMKMFKEAKVVASLTSSGLSNAIFMPDGGILVEVVTPLITQSPLVNSDYFEEIGVDPKDYEVDLNVVQEVHMFYHNLAFFKNLMYVGIPNYTREHQKVREFIESHPTLKALLSD